VIELSHHPKIQKVNALGTVLVLELVSTQKGYLSLSSQDFIQKLRRRGVYARPLGNVMYFMAGQKTEKEQLEKVMRAIQESLL
jgi:bifunctional dethiobiotin synthetase / adenosylmethionine---8-amino-7-oxononanoate aminotransferase